MICCLSEIQTYLGVLYFDLLKSNNATIVRKRNVLDCRDLAQWNLSIVQNNLHNGPNFRFSFSLSHYQRRITGCFSTLRKQNKQVNRKQLLSFTLFLCNVFPHCFSLAYLPANPTGWQTKWATVNRRNTGLFSVWSLLFSWSSSIIFSGSKILPSK